LTVRRLPFIPIEAAVGAGAAVPEVTAAASTG
jgi:hypothetical protein